MKVLRHGGSVSHGRIRDHGWKAVAWFGAAGFLFAASTYLGFKWAGLFVGAVMFLAATRRFDEWERWFPGMRGERHVTEALKSLPDDYVLLNYLMLPEGKGNVDHLLIGPNGLFVIETKCYSGIVRCEGDQWFVNDFRTRSLSRQVKRNALRVRSHLVNVFYEHRQRLPFVVALVVFVKPAQPLRLDQPAIPVLKLEELAQFVRSYNPRRPIPAQMVHAIVRHLKGIQFDTDDVQPLPLVPRAS